MHCARLDAAWRVPRFLLHKPLAAAQLETRSLDVGLAAHARRPALRDSSKHEVQHLHCLVTVVPSLKPHGTPSRLRWLAHLLPPRLMSTGGPGKASVIAASTMSAAAAAAQRAADTEPRPVEKSAEAPLSVLSNGRSASPAAAHANGVRDARSEEPLATEPMSPSSKVPASKSLPPEILGLFNRTDGSRAKDSSTHGQPLQVLQLRILNAPSVGSADLHDLLNSLSSPEFNSLSPCRKSRRAKRAVRAMKITREQMEDRVQRLREIT